MPKIIKKLQMSRYIEEILGGIGILYILFLTMVAYFLIAFLVNVISTITKIPFTSIQSTITGYDLDRARDLLKK
jgi:phosphate/sulfate permease